MLFITYPDMATPKQCGVVCLLQVSVCPCWSLLNVCVNTLHSGHKTVQQQACMTWYVQWVTYYISIPCACVFIIASYPGLFPCFSKIWEGQAGCTRLHSSYNVTQCYACIHGYKARHWVLVCPVWTLVVPYLTCMAFLLVNFLYSSTIVDEIIWHSSSYLPNWQLSLFHSTR